VRYGSDSIGSRYAGPRLRLLALRSFLQLAVLASYAQKGLTMPMRFKTCLNSSIAV
jgi:hypothetical protein